MSDPLKKYIQQAKHQLDAKQPDPDLFDKIMSQLNEDASKKEGIKIKIGRYAGWMAIAASFLLLIVSAVFLMNQKDTHILLSQNTQPISTPSNNDVKASHTTADLNQTAEGQATIPTQNLDIKQAVQNKSFLKQHVATKNLASSKSDLNGTKTAESDLSKQVINDQIVATSLPTEAVAIENKALLPSNTLSQMDAIVATDPVATSPIQVQSTPAEITKSLSQTESNEIQNSDPSGVGRINDQSIKGVIKKGFFNFLSKKAKQWSGDALQIEEQEKNNQTVLALQFKSEKFEFSKSIHF